MQAGRQSGRQASKQGGRQAGGRASKQASTRNAFSQSHALEGLVIILMSLLCSKFSVQVDKRYNVFLVSASAGMEKFGELS